MSMIRKVESLHGIIIPDRIEPPPDMIFVLVMQEPEVVDGIPTAQVEMETYARLKLLPKDLRDQVRKVLREQAGDWEIVRSKLHPKTGIEVSVTFKDGLPYDG